MIGIGTLVNGAAIVAGGLCGLFGGSRMNERCREGLSLACGISVLFIGIAGAMEKMLTVSNGVIGAGQSMLLTICLALGAFFGELMNIEGAFERFGVWLKKTGNSGDPVFVEGFVTASLTVSIGAMAIVGSIRDGIFGDWSILAAKAVLDFVIVRHRHDLRDGQGLYLLRNPRARVRGRDDARRFAAEAADDRPRAFVYFLNRLGADLLRRAEPRLRQKDPRGEPAPRDPSCCRRRVFADVKREKILQNKKAIPFRSTGSLLVCLFAAKQCDEDDRAGDDAQNGGDQCNKPFFKNAFFCR